MDRKTEGWQFFDNTKDLLTFIAAEYGNDAMFGKKHFADHSSPLMPTVQKNLLKQAFECGAVKILYDNMNSEKWRKEAAIKQAVSKMVDTYASAQKAAECVVWELVDAIGWDMVPQEHENIYVSNTLTNNSSFEVNRNEFNSVVSTGSKHTAVVRSDGSLWAWGANCDGQLGDGTNIGTHQVEDTFGTLWVNVTPTRIMDDVKSVSVGYGSTLVIKNDDSLWGWGCNSFGSLGIGSAEKHHFSHVKIMTDVSFVLNRGDRVFALTKNNVLWAWGNNQDGTTGGGLLGDVTNENRNSPVRILDDVIAISSNAQHAMAIKSDGSLWGWGMNNYGQLGDGTSIGRNEPVKIIDEVSLVYAGLCMTKAIRYDGSLWIWGFNLGGQVGDGTKEKRYNPVKIMDDVAFVSEEGDYAIKTDGGLYGWGMEYAQLEDGIITKPRRPIKIMDDVVTVRNGFSEPDIRTTIAVKNDGSLWKWGVAVSAWRGDGAKASKVPPVKILENVIAITGKKTHIMAVKADRSLWAWGYNQYGQLGDGTTTDSHRPIKIIDNIRV